VSTISVQQDKHLTPNEVETLIAAAKTNRYGLRDGLAILLAYRRGLRSSELVRPRPIIVLRLSAQGPLAPACTTLLASVIRPIKAHFRHLMGSWRTPST
jgi:hypothetical protein